ncbi:hypothetical protein RBI13_20665 [Alcaligenaceae bacterium A4P071]|nr:hypothetical protein [Alcaligenaceae bacterium A4P071]
MFEFLKRDSQDDTQQIQDEFVANVQAAADGFVADFARDDLVLDYGAASLRAVDMLLGQASLGKLELSSLQSLGAASYVYEVARRAHGGLYEVCDDDDPVVLVTGEPDFDVCLCAISKVEKAARGTDRGDSLPEFYQRFAAGVAARASEVIR